MASAWSEEEKRELINAVYRIGNALRELGNGNLGELGAIESFGVVVKEDLCTAIREAGASVKDGLIELAAAIEKAGDAIYSGSTFKSGQ